MPRFALKVEYNGAPFKGWQRQTDQITVQGNIEAALARLETRAHKIAAAGRTDAGVHAWGQVAHCDLSQDWAPFRLSEALNYHLKPSPIAIVDCARVSDEWHARFSAQERHYIYRVLIRRAPATHQEGLVWQVKRDLDIDAMNAGGALLTGTHDFTTFRSTICQSKSPVKTLSSLVAHRVESLQGDEIHFDVRARSFLHNQVRSFVGSLEQVGAGSWTLGDLAKALAAKDRNACGPVSPSKGLYLAHVEYAEDPFAVTD